MLDAGAAGPGQEARGDVSPQAAGGEDQDDDEGGLAHRRKVERAAEVDRVAQHPRGSSP